MSPNTELKSELISDKSGDDMRGPGRSEEELETVRVTQALWLG